MSFSIVSAHDTEISILAARLEGLEAQQNTVEAQAVKLRMVMLQ